MTHKNTTYLSVIALFFVILCSPCGAAEWSWNPLSKSTSSASRSSSPLYSSNSGTKKSSWLPTFKAPKMPWSSSSPNVSSYSKNKTSTWNRMSKTSKRWWNKTTEMLDPYPDPKPSTYANNSGTEKKKSSWFGSWFQSKEQTPIKTVPDFLKQQSPS